MRDYNRAYRQANGPRLSELKLRGLERAKSEGIEAYGGACNCCGESNRKFLTVDHINGRGGETYRITGKKSWLRLKSLGWPKDNYQLLCFNCNCAKGAYGQCPHMETNT